MILNKVSPFHNPDDEPIKEEIVIFPLSDNTDRVASDYRDHLYASVIQLARAQKLLQKQADVLLQEERTRTENLLQLGQLNEEQEAI